MIDGGNAVAALFLHFACRTPGQSIRDAQSNMHRLKMLTLRQAIEAGAGKAPFDADLMCDKGDDGCVSKNGFMLSAELPVANIVCSQRLGVS